jgi:LysR family transcriptional regulator, carnitine catabolism transcriptional activator
MAGKLELGLGIFEPVPGVKRTPFFRFSLVLIRAEQPGASVRASVNWAALDGMPLIALPADNPTQRLIDAELARAGVSCPREAVVNLLDTQIALVEANEGAAIIPSFGLPVARRKIVATPLANPAVHLNYHQIHSRAKPLSKDALEFCAFLKAYVSRWALTSTV